VIYLDNNATTCTLPSVNEAVLHTLEKHWGNPSSLHSVGGEARSLLNSSRNSIASFLGALEENIYFTSSGTEANNIAINSALARNQRQLITSTVEHSSVLKLAEHFEAEGREVHYLSVDETGLISLPELKKLTRDKPSLVSIQGANSETGVIQPISEIASLCEETGALFHCDLAQLAGRAELNLEEIGLHFATLSGHKLHAPKGVGVLYSKNTSLLKSFYKGGEQESGIVPGTENLASIAGLSKAIEIRRDSLQENLEHLEGLRESFYLELKASASEIEKNVAHSNTVSNTLNLYFPEVGSLSLLASLSQYGVACSHASACLSARPEPSYVLTAMGYSEERASESLRFSFSVLNSKEEASKAAKIVANSYYELKSRMKELYG